MGLPCQRHQGPFFFHTKTANLALMLLIIVVSLFSVILSQPSQLQRLRNCRGRRKSRYRMISSIMPAPEHRLCSSTGKRISKVDGVLLLVCARLSACMVAQGQSPFRQKSSLNRSSRICEARKKLGEKIVSQMKKRKKKPSRILYTLRQIILVLYLERNCSRPLALGKKKKKKRCFFHKGNIQNLVGGTKKHEHGKKKTFTPNISQSAAGLLFSSLFFKIQS